MRQRTKLTTIATMVALTTLVAFSALAISASKAVTTLLGQTEAAFLAPQGLNTNDALKNYPNIVAVTMGMAMQRQKDHLRTNPDYEKHFEWLLEEVRIFLGTLAGLHKYKHPDGSDLSLEIMDQLFMQGLAGRFDKQFANKFGINPATVNLPMMLAQVQVQEVETGARGKWTQKESDSINLLDQQANEVVNNTPEPPPAPQSVWLPTKGLLLTDNTCNNDIHSLNPKADLSITSREESNGTIRFGAKFEGFFTPDGWVPNTKGITITGTISNSASAPTVEYYISNVRCTGRDIKPNDNIISFTGCCNGGDFSLHVW